MDKKILGLIAGNGKYPFVFAGEAKKKGYCVVAAAVKGDTLPVLGFFVGKIKWFSAGELKSLFTYFKDAGVTDVIMAGQVSQKNLFDKNLQTDEEFRDIFQAIGDRKADTIFTAVADKLKGYGMRLMDSTFLLEDYLAIKGTLSKRAPSLEELADIEFGRNLAKSMGAIDVGQTVVVKDKAIVAVEAMEGTDQTILRGGKIARNGAVVVKMSKPDQDMRFDVPVIGPRTVKNMARCGCSCLAVEAGKTLIIEQDKCLRLANKHKITIVAC